jgi:hypothetical protein
MYTSYIGKKFLKCYNEKENKKLSARAFFEEVFFPIFFENESHLLHVSNSPFFQKPKEEDVKKNGGKALAQLHNLHESIAKDAPNMSIFVGFAAKDIQGTTSGQLTSMDFKINAEEMYASWIGQALAIGLNGGFVMLIDEESLLFALYEGWANYRKYLQQTPNVKDKQIETWNGQWLCHRLGKNYNPDDVWENFHVEVENNMGKIAIPTKKWSEVIFVLAKKYPNTTPVAYCYNLSQTNTTLGFIKLYLPQVAEMYEWRDKLFLEKEATVLMDKQIEKLETFYNFKGACRMGTIGLKALEPQKLREYMPKGSVIYAQGKDYKFTDGKSHFDYQLYKLWIMAITSKKELLHLATELAKVLIAFEKEAKGSDRGKTTERQEAKNVREAKHIVEFTNALEGILSKTSGNQEVFRNVLVEALEMPKDNFPLFIALIRFEYQYLKQQ